MGYFVLSAVALLLGFLLISALRDLKARTLRLAALAILFALAATCVVIFALSGRFGLAAPAGAQSLWVMRAYLLARQIKASGGAGQAPQKSTGPMSRAEALDI